MARPKAKSFRKKKRANTQLLKATLGWKTRGWHLANSEFVLRFSYLLRCWFLQLIVVDVFIVSLVFNFVFYFFCTDKFWKGPNVFCWCVGLSGEIWQCQGCPFLDLIFTFLRVFFHVFCLILAEFVSCFLLEFGFLWLVSEDSSGLALWIVGFWLLRFLALWLLWILWLSRLLQLLWILGFWLPWQVLQNIKGNKANNSNNIDNNTKPTKTTQWRTVCRFSHPPQD